MKQRDLGTAPSLMAPHVAPFSVLWGLAHVVHTAAQSAGRFSLTGAATFAAALWLMASPRSSSRLALLAVAQLVDTAATLPLAPDHWILVAFVNVVILGTHLGPDRAEARFVPGARFALLISYGAAAVAKYNDDFLQTAESCATRLAEAATFGAVDRSGAAAGLAIAGTLVAETAIPVLLLVRRTRTAGVVLGMTFHFLVSLSPAIGVGDYTTTLWALLVLFLSPEARLGIARRVRTRADRFTVVRDLRRAPPLVTVAVTTAVVMLAGLPQQGVLVLLAAWLLVTGTGVVLLVAVARTVRRDRPHVQPIDRPDVASVAVVTCLLLVASGPYLGFGTAARFAMFSNLRTEGPGTNHLFLPSVHLIDSQNDWLLVEELDRDRADDRSGIPDPDEFRTAIPVAELRRILSDPDTSGVFRTPDGERIVVEAREPHPLRSGARWWEAKTQYYRPFAVDGVTESGFCSG